MNRLWRILTVATFVVAGSGLASAAMIYNDQSTNVITSGDNTDDFDWHNIAQLSIDQRFSSVSTAETEAPDTQTSGTPEPATMALMGGALLGLGLIGKRLKKP